MASTGGLNLLFSSVTYEVGSVSKPTLILKGVSGYAMPGQLVALMGPSGCGKTTLLDILSGRKSSGRIQGQILLGGLPPSKSFLRRCVYRLLLNVHFTSGFPMRNEPSQRV